MRAARNRTTRRKQECALGTVRYGMMKRTNDDPNARSNATMRLEIRMYGLPSDRDDADGGTRDEARHVPCVRSQWRRIETYGVVSEV